MPAPTVSRSQCTNTRRRPAACAAVLALCLLLETVPAVAVDEAFADSSGSEPAHQPLPGVVEADPTVPLATPAPRRPAVPGSGAAPTRPTALPQPMAPGDTRGVFATPYVHDPVTGRHLALIGGRLRAFDDAGREVASRDIDVPFGNLVLDGDLFVQGPGSVVEVDRRTLARIEQYPLEGRPHLVGDELWALVWDRWEVVDRSTGDRRSVPTEQWATTIHVPAFGSRILVRRNVGGIALLDVSVDPPVIVEDLPGSGLIDVARDGTVLTTETDGSVTRRRPDLTVIDSTPIAVSGIGSTRWAGGAGLFVVPEDGRLSLRRPGSGDHVVSIASPPFGTQIVDVTPDGRLVLASEGGPPRIASFAPVIERTSAAVFRPAWAPTLTVYGTSTEAVTAARVDGVAVPLRRRASGAVELDVSGLSGTGPAEVVLSSPFGDGRFTIAATQPRGSSLLTVRSTSLGAADAPTGWLVRCDDWRLRGSQLPGAVDVVAVPSLEECSVTFSGGSVDGIRSGRVEVDEPGAPMVPLFGDAVPFVSGAPVHVEAIVRDPAETRFLGLVVGDLGAPPAAALRRFRITCGSWSVDVETVGRAEAAVEVPTSIARTQRCNAVVTDAGGATRIAAAVLAQDTTPQFEDGQRLGFRLDRAVGNAYLFFAFDHGGSDLEAPIVIGEPGAAVRGRRAAGAVRVVPSFAGATPDPSSTTLLTQRAVAGRPGRGDRFGAAVAMGDFDGDGRLDVAVGVPGERVGGRRGAGIVQIFPGSDRGFSTREVVTLDRRAAGAGTPARNDGFGTALAVVDFDGDGIDDLAVGAPGASVGRARTAGEVLVFAGTSAGLASRAAHRITQRDMPQARPERGDRFGATLAAERGYLAIGAPGESVGRFRSAGVVHRIDGFTLETHTLEAPRPSRGDGHGSSVDVDRDGRVVAGAPGRDGVGAITIHTITETGIETRVISQGELRSRLAAPGNRFGAAVAITGERDFMEILVGAPGTDFDGVIDAGVVHLVRPGWQVPERGLIFSSFVGLDRVSPSDAEFGSTLAAGRRSQLLVGVPAGGPRGSGAVAVYTGRWYLLHDGLPRWGAPRPGDDLGAAVAG